ncbi:VOC family protein [Mycolicibacterium wolinskyi]|uniref:VOC family protein n=1 Tax=Mycolicibacterium wolinskyi TaxID=59750 RepID=UPI0039177913
MPLLAPSKPVGSDSTRPPLAGLHHFGLSVADLQRSIRFYCDVLGAAVLVADTPEGEDQRRFSGRAAILSLGGQVLDLCEHSSNARERFDPVRTGLDHFALEAESLADLQAWASWLDTSGVARSEIRKVAGDLGTMFDFVDPDGSQVEFVHFDLG